MRTLGLTTRIPRVIGVQAAGALPIAQAFRSGKALKPQGANTLADGVAVSTPRNWRKALTAVRQLGGTVVTVTDEEILEAMGLLARTSGLWGEPAAVTSVAALRGLIERGEVASTERILLVITGTGLKDIPSTLRAAGGAIEIDPSLKAVAEVVGRGARRDA